MCLFRNISFVFTILISTLSLGQQIDFKEFVKSDSSIINKNTVFNWYWSPILNKQFKIRRIREFKVCKKDTIYDTLKINTLFFDRDGKIKRWNNVAFRYSSAGGYLGYVDTAKSMVVLPVNYNPHAFVDFFYYTEKRDEQNNQLNNSLVINTPISDTLNVLYSYNPVIYIKSHETEINGEKIVLPDGPASYLHSIKILKNDVFYRENFLVYEFYED
jgi:hypothetical protein